MPQVPKPETKRRFVSAARSEFTTHGFHNASLRAIATAAGGSLGNLRGYFPSKDVLFAAACGPVPDEVLRAIEAANTLPTSSTNTEALNTGDALVQRVVEYVVEHRVELLLLLDKSAGSALAGWRDEVLAAYLRMEEARLRAFVDAYPGGLREVPSSRLVHGLCRLYFGLTEDFVRGAMNEAELRSAVAEFDAFRRAGTLSLLGDAS